MIDLLAPAGQGGACALRGAALEGLARHPQLPLPGHGDTLERWRILAGIAATDVCLAKVLEAHYDAQAILAELGAPPASPAQLFAVWAAEAPDARLAYRGDTAQRGQVHGRKAWCSGAGIVDAALLTAHDQDRQQLVQVQLRQPGIAIDAQAWAAVGMARVVSGPVTFAAVPATALGARRAGTCRVRASGTAAPGSPPAGSARRRRWPSACARTPSCRATRMPPCTWARSTSSSARARCCANWPRPSTLRPPRITGTR
ncbi:hypothetical protein ACFQGW_08610 [Xanthomonas theicola]|uniref:hypothetical protein n=1 Tax=Xanthomonas theicola TaxID=56464 RepID=UPI00361DD709